MRWFWALLLVSLWGSVGQAAEPKPLQFATTAPRVEVVSAASQETAKATETKPVRTAIGSMGALNNPQIVGLLVSTVKAKMNRIERDQKAYLDEVERQGGMRARKEADEKLSRYQLLGLDEQGLDYRTYINTVNAEPKKAAQDLLDRVDATRPDDLAQEDYDALSAMAEAHFMLTTGMSSQEWMMMLLNESDKPVVQGERFWTL